MSIKKTIIIDFGKISTPYCGLAETSLNFAQALELQKVDAFDFVYIVPKALHSTFQEQVGVNAVVPKYYGIRRLLYYVTRKKSFLCEMPKYDLYHYLHFYSPWGVKSNGKNKILLTVHDLHALERKRAAKRLRDRLSDVGYVALISKFALCEYHKSFAALGIPTRVIANGVRKPPVVDDESVIKQLELHGKFLFTLGGLKRKNIHSLIGMVEKFQKFSESDGMKLLVAGGIKSKYKKELLNECMQRGVLDKVIFLGPVSENEKFVLMKACQAFVFPSLQEGFGLPVIEAMHFGKPVFCSNKTSLPEIGGELAEYWNNFDPQYMAEIVHNGLKNDYQDAETNKSLRIRYANSFDWNINASEYIKYYKEILLDQSK